MHIKRVIDGVLKRIYGGGHVIIIAIFEKTAGTDAVYMQE